MSKKLIFGLALALVMVSGFGFYARADRGQTSDMDRSEATCQGAYNYGPSTPSPMGAPVAY